jgi:hypothetical protein
MQSLSASSTILSTSSAEPTGDDDSGDRGDAGDDDCHVWAPWNVPAPTCTARGMAPLPAAVLDADTSCPRRPGGLATRVCVDASDVDDTAVERTLSPSVNGVPMPCHCPVPTLVGSVSPCDAPRKWLRSPSESPASPTTSRSRCTPLAPPPPPPRRRRDDPADGCRATTDTRVGPLAQAPPRRTSVLVGDGDSEPERLAGSCQLPTTDAAVPLVTAVDETPLDCLRGCTCRCCAVGGAGGVTHRTVDPTTASDAPPIDGLAGCANMLIMRSSTLLGVAVGRSSHKSSPSPDTVVTPSPAAVQPCTSPLASPRPRCS